MQVAAVYAGLLLHKREGREIEWAINVNVKRAWWAPNISCLLKSVSVRAEMALRSWMRASPFWYKYRVRARAVSLRVILKWGCKKGGISNQHMDRVVVGYPNILHTSLKCRPSFEMWWFSNKAASASAFLEGHCGERGFPVCVDLKTVRKAAERPTDRQTQEAQRQCDATEQREGGGGRADGCPSPSANHAMPLLQRRFVYTLLFSAS